MTCKCGQTVVTVEPGDTLRCICVGCGRDRAEEFLPEKEGCCSLMIDKNIIMDEDKHTENATWVGSMVLRRLKDSIDIGYGNEIVVGPMTLEE